VPAATVESLTAAVTPAETPTSLSPALAPPVDDYVFLMNFTTFAEWNKVVDLVFSCCPDI